MDRVIAAVERIQALSDAQVDRSFRQGRDAVLAQLTLREGAEAAATWVDESLLDYRKDIEEIRDWVKPYRLPDDYRFCLEFYGGLLIETPDYNLIVEGIGPMVEEWYGFLKGDDAFTDPQRDGLLKISELVFKHPRDGVYPLVAFFIDLAGHVQSGSILSIGPWAAHDPDLSAIITDFSAHPTMWKKVANSFTHWLELVAETHGTLGYA